MPAGLSITFTLIIAAVGGGTIGTIIQAVLSRKTKLAGQEQTANAQLVDDMQDQLKRLTARVNHLERTEKLKDNYIAQLRNHIYDNKGPPPPDWPDHFVS